MVVARSSMLPERWSVSLAVIFITQGGIVREIIKRCHRPPPHPIEKVDLEVLYIGIALNARLKSGYDGLWLKTGGGESCSSSPVPGVDEVMARSIYKGRSGELDAGKKGQMSQAVVCRRRMDVDD
jgi:hypothetical protein